MRKIGPTVFVPLLVGSMFWLSAPAAQATDLNGDWQDGPRVLTITQSDLAVGATIKTGSHSCGATGITFSGTLNGNKLTGTNLLVCNPPSCVEAGKLPLTDERPYTATVADDAMSVAFTWTEQRFDSREDSEGNVTGCPKTGTTQKTFTLTRLSPTCDEEALEAAKEEYKRLVETAAWLAANARDMSDGAMAAHEEMGDHFYSFVGAKAFSQVSGKLWGKVPEPLRTATKTGIGTYTAETPGDAVKTSLDAAKGLSDHLSDTASWAKTGSQAFKKASWGSLLVDLGLLAANMNTSYAVGERYSKEGARANEAYHKMMELALEAKRRWEALEEQCRESGGQPEPADEEAAADMTADQQRVAAAAELINSWERIGGIYVDLQGNAYDEQAAWDRALDIVGSGGQGFAAEHAESGDGSAAAMPVEAAGEEFSPQELSAFVDHMRRGLDLLAIRLEAYPKVEAEMAKSAR